jgi:hypothetical protein
MNMYDFWYALGTAVMDLKLLTSIPTAIANSEKGVCFKKLAARVFIETQPDGSVKVIQNTGSSGTFDLKGLTAVRKAIRAFIQKAPGAPPVSLYCGGKFSQFLAVGVIDTQANLDFTGIIELANQGFTAVGGGASVSAAFTALLGLCLIDQKARLVVAGTLPPNQDIPPRADVLTEFGLTDSAENARITSIANNPSFIDAQNSLVFGDRNTWDPNESCSEQFLSWEDHSERIAF